MHAADPTAEHTAGDLPLGPGVELLREGPLGLLAMDKPVGVKTHPNAREKQRTLLLADYDAKQECYRWSDARGQSRQLWLVHRLDSPTSGLILAARSQRVAAAAKEAFKRRNVSKHYLAVVIGTPSGEVVSWSDRLAIGRGGSAPVRIAKQGSVARTHARCLTLSGSEPKLALLLLQPQTGRRHQLRVQCAHHRLPILGDRTYGDFRQNRQLERRPQIARRLYLHAWALSVELGLDGKTQRFTAQSDPPRAFAQALGMEDLRGELSDAEDRTDTG